MSKFFIKGKLRSVLVKNKNPDKTMKIANILDTILPCTVSVDIRTNNSPNAVDAKGKITKGITFIGISFNEITALP